MTSDNNTGLQYDQGKNRLDLFPFAALEEVGRAFTYGAKKYEVDGVPGDHNYRKGFLWTRYLGSCLRHVFKWAQGEDTDPESGLPHLAMACCRLLMLLDAHLHKYGTDNRWRP